MAVVSHEVHPLFVEPYFRANIAGSITPEQIEFIKNLKMVNNVENFMSENLYIFEEPELKSIKDAVQEVLDIYAREPGQQLLESLSRPLRCRAESGGVGAR